MTVLVTSDLHVSDNPRDAYRWAWLKKLPTLLRSKKVELLIILGDLTEAKGNHSAELVNMLVDQFQALTEVCPIIILRANHDGFTPAAPYFAFLRHLEGISWVGQPTPLTDLNNVPATAARSLGRAIFAPFSPNYERDWADIDFKTYEVAFMHQTFAGSISDSGFKLEGIPLSYFPKNLRIISGDIHRPQELGNLTYVGAPFHIDFGDSWEPRCLLIEDKNNWFVVPCTGPQKRLVEIQSLDELEQLEEVFKGDILKVRVSLKANEYSHWPETVAAVRAWGAKEGYVINMVQPVITATRQSMSSQRKNVARKDDAAVLKDYAAHQSVGEDTLKTGLKLLEEA